jgi:hypothetical protein
VAEARDLSRAGQLNRATRRYRVRHGLPAVPSPRVLDLDLLAPDDRRTDGQHVAALGALREIVRRELPKAWARHANRRRRFLPVPALASRIRARGPSRQARPVRRARPPARAPARAGGDPPDADSLKPPLRQERAA